MELLVDLRPLTGGVTPRKEWTKRPGCKASKCWHMKICRELTCSPFPGRALGVPSPVAGRVCTCCVPALQVQGPGWGLDTRVSLTILTAAQRAQGGGAVTQHSHSIISTDRHAAEDTYPLPQDLAGGSPLGYPPFPFHAEPAVATAWLTWETWHPHRLPNRAVSTCVKGGSLRGQVGHKDMPLRRSGSASGR